MLEPVGYHSQVQPQHLQAVLPRVCQGHRLREGEHPHSSPPKNRPCTTEVLAGSGLFRPILAPGCARSRRADGPELDIDRARERVVVSHRFPAVARLEISPSPPQFHPCARDHRKRQKLTSPPRLFPAEQLSAPCLVRYAWGKLANIRVDFVHLLDVIYTAFGVSTLERGRRRQASLQPPPSNDVNLFQRLFETHPAARFPDYYPSTLTPRNYAYTPRHTRRPPRDCLLPGLRTRDRLYAPRLAGAVVTDSLDWFALLG